MAVFVKQMQSKIPKEFSIAFASQTLLLDLQYYRFLYFVVVRYVCKTTSTENSCGTYPANITSTRNALINGCSSTTKFVLSANVPLMNHLKMWKLCNKVYNRMRVRMIHCVYHKVFTCREIKLSTSRTNRSCKSSGNTAKGGTCTKSEYVPFFSDM